MTTLATLDQLVTRATTIAHDESRPLECFIDTTPYAHTDIYAPVYAPTTNLYKLTPIGTWLDQLGGVVKEKLSPAIRCAIGHLVYNNVADYKHLAMDNPSAFIEAFYAVDELVKTGETRRMAVVDAAASAFQIIGANGNDTGLLQQVIGTPCTPQEHFYRPPTDYYTNVRDEAQLILNKYATERAPARDLSDLKRKYYKNAITTKTYGKQKALQEIEGLEGDELAAAAFGQAHATLAPSADQWNDAALSADMSGVDTVTIINPLRELVWGKAPIKAGWHRTTPDSFEILADGGLGSVTSNITRKLEPTDKYYSSAIELIANLVHNCDGTLIGIIAEVFAEAGLSHTHKHDANKVLPQYIDLIEVITRDFLIGVAIHQPLAVMLSQATGTTVVTPRIDLQGTIELLKQTNGANG